jgi:hypothetical protein
MRKMIPEAEPNDATCCFARDAKLLHRRTLARRLAGTQFHSVPHPLNTTKHAIAAGIAVQVAP